MKTFNLEKAKAGEPVVCRDGIPARIICFDRNHPIYKIVALLTVTDLTGMCIESVEVYREDGRYVGTDISTFDLKML